MDQELGVGGGGDMNRQQPQEGGGEQQVQPQQSQTQSCPRCKSLNTKFCYYNNYSLLQPRYFCKTCKRHWTQGGNLRNVPIGGRSRKEKHAKNSSSSRLHQPPPPSPHDVVVQTQQPNLTTMIKANSIRDQGSREYLSSMPMTHSMNQSQSLIFDHSVKDGDGVFGSSSNLSLVSGSSAASLAFEHQIQSSQLYQTAGREKEVDSLSTSQQGLIIPSMDNINSSDASYNDWLQNFINTTNNKTCDASLWSTIEYGSTSISVNTKRNTNVVGSSPLILNQKPDFPGCGPHSSCH